MHLLGSPGDIQSGSIFMSSLWMDENPDIGCHSCIHISGVNRLLRETGRWKQKTEQIQRRGDHRIEMGAENGEERQRDTHIG